MSKNTLPDFFIQASEKLTIPLSEEAGLKFETYYQELIAWNKRINLTRITERKRFFIEHFIDSLIPERFIPSKSSLIDLGSGGGFPGLPLKIIRPDLSVTLVDSSLKKILFLRYLVRLLDLRGIVVIQERLGRDFSDHRYDVCIGRAFAPLERFLPLAFALKNPQGIVIAMKGPNFLNELKAVEPKFLRWGISLKHLEKFVLPFTNKQRTIIIFG
ncbi:MAG: 16S rRNA (guanine(527)-N(7))-methyltransferase RsmG [Thermodesulfobacteriota bacterium]|nr:MAG: 16S rRNA (guanine(527)-N(7))-methyltransferase RsmG [Thermodesulfobacteriota bacterium]